MPAQVCTICLGACVGVGMRACICVWANAWKSVNMRVCVCVCPRVCRRLYECTHYLFSAGYSLLTVVVWWCVYH